MPLRRPDRGGGDLTDAILQAQEGAQAALWTAMPARVERFYPERSCVDCQVLVQSVFGDERGAERFLDPPLLVDCPVQFPRGGGFALTFPLLPGDEGLVVFASRCIDAWWQSGPRPDGGPQPPAELRMHDLSDGFFLAGARSLPHVEESINPTDVELRSVDPAGPRVSLTSGGSARIYGVASALVQSDVAVTVLAPTINLVGNVVVNGEAYTAHRHSGVAAGGANTGGKV
jgi:hypothetical protein